MPMIDVGAAAPAGYVRAVFSDRCKGHAAPLDLMRALLRACRIARGRAIFYAAREAERARVARAFADYLVTDSDDEALRWLETRAAFSERRKNYRMRLDRLGATGRGPWSFDLQDFSDGGHGCMDAPGYLAAGAMFSYRCSQSGDVVRSPRLWKRPE